MLYMYSTSYGMWMYDVKEESMECSCIAQPAQPMSRLPAVPQPKRADQRGKHRDSYRDYGSHHWYLYNCSNG